MIAIDEIESYSDLAGIVNPDGESLLVKYCGPSGDLKTGVLTTNSDSFDYVDRYPLHAVGGLPVYERLIEEAVELGIKDLTIIDGGDIARINYTFRHKRDKHPRPREINYHVADASSFQHPVSDRYDVLIIRGEASSFEGHDFQMRELGENMTVGGHFISDRRIARYLLPEWIGFEEIQNDTLFPRGPARVYRKNRQEDKALLSDLFMFNDAVSDVIAYIRGGNSYSVFRNTPIPLGFIKNRGDLKARFENGLAAKYSAVCKIYRRLPEKIKIEALPILLEPEFSPSTQPEAHDQFRQLLLHI